MSQISLIQSNRLVFECKLNANTFLLLKPDGQEQNELVKIKVEAVTGA